jgi:hypothetical protein
MRSHTGGRRKDMAGKEKRYGGKRCGWKRYGGEDLIFKWQKDERWITHANYIIITAWY